jgi:glyoxylase-like metal-dependent hydrolase (beta-lactamase superfamily II)
MTEVIPGIHWLKLPITMPESTLAYVNAYLIQGDSGYLLVDAGWNTDETFDALQKQLAEIGTDIKDISQILVTHVHPDHYGLAGRIKQLSGAIFSLHEIEKGFIETRYINMDELLEQTAHWLDANGTPPDETAEMKDATLGIQQYVVPTYPDFTLHGGETMAVGMFTFQVLWTPGHSSGHVCLYEPEKKVLISGDHILPTITPNISRHPQSIENTLGKYLQSLNEVKQLDTELILPGHEKPFTQLRPRIDELIQHHEQRNLEILATLKGETKTAYQIAKGITWGIDAGWQNLPSFHKRMAIFETLAHLELMTINGQIGKISKDSVIYYQQT